MVPRVHRYPKWVSPRKAGDKGCQDGNLSRAPLTGLVVVRGRAVQDLVVEVGGICEKERSKTQLVLVLLGVVD